MNSIYGFLLISLVMLSGCGTLTGIPSHGGGKRFAVEQELVAAATRGAIKQIDLSIIRGKKVNLFVNSIGDQGTGNIIGGRFSIASQLRGNYLQSPTTTEKRTFPRYTSTTTTQSNSNNSQSSLADSLSDSLTDSLTNGLSGTSSNSVSDDFFTTTTSSSNSSTNSSSNSSSNTSSSSSSNSSTNSSNSTSSVSTTDTLLPLPDTITSQQKGNGGIVEVGLEYKGLGTYTNSDRVVADDIEYLSALLQTYLFLRGVHVVPPSEAEVDVYILVDVFGTVRTRVEWFLANNEILRAKTSFEVMAVDHLTGQLIMPPQTAAAETEYNEQYILWAGPVIIKKTLNTATPLLSDFTDITDVYEGNGVVKPAKQDVPIPYPFSHEIHEYWKDPNDEEVPPDP